VFRITFGSGFCDHGLRLADEVSAPYLERGMTLPEKLTPATEAVPPWRWIACAPRLAGRALIKVYRLTLSPLIGFHCRHLPTCSEYADAALARFGRWAGVWMTFARLCRCHPFGTSGLDFVPAALPPGARWYLPWRYGRWRGTNDQTGT
jgi:putative membrane protein insertion efficiency factor